MLRLRSVLIHTLTTGLLFSLAAGAAGATRDPGARCVAHKARALARACSADLHALGNLARGGDYHRFESRIAHSHSRLASRFARAEDRSRGACPAFGAPEEAMRVVGDMLEGVLEASSHSPAIGPCEVARLKAAARKCAADLSAWSHYARRGDAGAREQALATSDARFEAGWARAARRGGECGSDGRKDSVRAVLDQAASELVELAALTRETPVAELLRPEVVFAPGERQKHVWIPLPAEGVVLFDGTRGVHATAHDRTGRIAAAAGSTVDEFGAAELTLEEPAEHYGLTFTRTGSLREGKSVNVAVLFDFPEELFGGPGPSWDTVVYSPLRTFPEGEDVLQLPVDAPVESFEAWVYDQWGFYLEEGLPAELWYVASELAWSTCPAGQAAPTPGAAPPPGSTHDDNYCGISVFVHSMTTTFPGALKANVTTNAASWDAVGASIDHSNWFGTRGAKLVSNVNKNFQGASNVSQDGRQYCAAKIKDVSPANLAAWQEDCNLKVLTFEFSNGFGHWADVTQVTPNANNPNAATLRLQDYGANYQVGYTVANNVLTQTPMVDFSHPSAAGSTMAGNFNGTNTIAGDDWDEPTGFSVVCPCDTSGTTPKMPGATRSGKTLLP
jgi:hypothetical protein